MFKFLKKHQAAAPWGLFAFFVFCFLVYPGSPFASFYGQGADDYLRLVRVRDLLSGAGWHDNLIVNLGPLGSEIFWSRLVDMPLYLAAKVFSLHVPMDRALELAALWVPLFYASLLIPLGAAMARPFVPKTKAWLGGLILLSFSSPFLFQFLPGRVDHHAVFLLLSGASFAVLVRMLVLPHRFLPAVSLALFCALGLAVGGAFLPMLLLVTGALAFGVAWRGGPLQQRAAFFGMALGLFCLILLVFLCPSSMRFSHALLWFSGAHVLLALLIGGLFIFFERFAGRVPVREMRLVLMAGFSLLMALLFFALVPEAWQNPLGDFQASSAKIIMGFVTESRSLLYTLQHRTATAWGAAYYLLTLTPLFIGLLVFVKRNNFRADRRARLFYLTLLFWGSYTGLALFFQMRFLPYAQLFSVPFLSYFLWCWMARAGKKKGGFFRQVFILFFILFGFSTFLPMFPSSSQGLKDLSLFYAARPRPKCDVRAAASSLAQLGGPLTIANLINEGSELLYYTKHRILAAPYNVSSNKMMFDFFTDRDGTAAKDIAEKLHVDLVLVCKNVPRPYLGFGDGSGRKPVLRRGRDGHYHIQSDADHPTLLERLAYSQPPRWLEPVEDFYDEDYLLYKPKR